MSGMSRRAVLAAGFVLPLVGCLPGRRLRSLRIMVPTPPGGGFDHTARTMASVLEESGSVTSTTVFNLPGASGTAGLARLLYERGTPDLLLQMGLGVVANTHAASASQSVTEAEPLARLLQEPEVLLVTPDSPFRSIDDLLEAWRENPEDITVGGGSTPAGPDHMVTMLLAEKLGIDPLAVDYRSFDGGGPMQAALISREVDFAAAGPSEQRSAIEAGQLRVLTVTSSEPDPGTDAPTLVQAGVDLRFMNWRGLLAPPGLDTDALERPRSMVSDMHGSAQWRERLERNRWTDAFMEGEDFADFLNREDTRIGADLERLGLA